MTDEEINDLIKSNFELSMRLAGHRTDGQISYLFGRPLNEVANIFVQYEDSKTKNRFRGEFKIGGIRSDVKDKTIKLYRRGNIESKGFEDSIEPGVMAWDDPTQELFYRGLNGQLYRAKFEEVNG